MSPHFFILYVIVHSMIKGRKQTKQGNRHYQKETNPRLYIEDFINSEGRYRDSEQQITSDWWSVWPFGVSVRLHNFVYQC